jgi:N-acylneuraminate cytidylyltransferase
MKDKVLAIIPARGGSKRIPRKNIKNFLDKPIIAYSIETAINSNLFDEVMVSTDDEEIAEISRKYGAKVPFARSKKNSNDFSATVDVIEEVLKSYSKKGKRFCVFCCLYPTAPLISQDNLRKGFELLKAGNLISVFPVVQFSYPIQRALRLDKNYKAEMIWPENQKERSQDLEKTYHDAGQFYWGISEKILKEKTLFNKNSGAVVLKETEVQDIDNLEDWKMAEIKYQFLNK